MSADISSLTNIVPLSGQTRADSIEDRIVIYPKQTPSLVLLIFRFVCSLYTIMSYDHSNFVIELNEFDRSIGQEFGDNVPKDTLR
jgi:hypothetical protein